MSQIIDVTNCKSRLSKNLDNYRRSHKMTILAIVKKIGISKTTYNNIVLYNKSCDITTLALISKKLSISADTLLFGDISKKCDMDNQTIMDMKKAINHLNKRMIAIEERIEN